MLVARATRQEPSDLGVSERLVLIKSLLASQSPLEAQCGLHQKPTPKLHRLRWSRVAAQELGPSEKAIKTQPAD